MADTIVISDGEEDDEPRGAAESRDCNIIDLTSNQCALGNLPEMDSSIIDLTTYEDGLGSSAVESPLKDELSNSDTSEDLYLPWNSFSGGNSEYKKETTWCSWRINGDTSSIEDGILQRDGSTSGNDECLTESSRNEMCLPDNGNLNEFSNTAFTLQGWSPLPTPTCGESSSDYSTRFPNVNCQPQSETDSISSLATAEESSTQPSPINKALLYKLRCFKKTPVSHFFHKCEKMEKNGSSKPIPQSRMNIVNNTREEGIHQGTLHFLSQFVTAKHFPPDDIVTHVIQSILLGSEEQAMQCEAYMILMQVQKLHPATVNTVAWNWSLLSEVMERKENHASLLFLQYVVQTLDDDFEIHLKQRRFQKSLCKAMLSCDKPNIKNVIAWLIHAVENACDIAVNDELDARSECEQRTVFLLQRMLSIAVEVDNLPAMNSNRIADLLFPHVIVLKTRQQRELFFISTENHLLRAKILELIFLNSCEPMPPSDIPLSLGKILHFIGNSTLLLENQGPEWQRWDEILHHICLLFLSLQRIIKDHLLTPITDRTDTFCQRPHMQITEDITEADVEHWLLLFWTRTALGSDVPVELQHRFSMLRSMLLTAVKRQNL